MIAVAAVGPAGVSVAAPGSSDPKAAARRKLVEGAELLKRGEYQAALDRFQAAYELVPNPKIQYNFGLAYMGLGRNADALAAFHTFLSESSDASSDTITKARIHKEGLVRIICRLTVRADLDGAAIAIDGRSYGKTPRVEEILLDAGAHSLRVEKAGIARSFTQAFNAAPGQSMTIDAKLLTPEPDLAAAPVAPPPRLEGIAAAPSPEPASSPPRRWARWSGLAAGGLAVVALGFGTVEWVVKEQRYRKFNDDPSCDRKFADQGGASCAALLSEGDTAKRLGYTGFAVAGGLGVASAVFLLVGSSHHHSSGGVETAFACAPSVAVPGGFCRLSF